MFLLAARSDILSIDNRSIFAPRTTCRKYEEKLGDHQPNNHFDSYCDKIIADLRRDVSPKHDIRRGYTLDKDYHPYYITLKRISNENKCYIQDNEYFPFFVVAREFSFTVNKFL